MKKITIFLVIVCLCFFSCKNNDLKKSITSTVRFSIEKRYVVKEIFDSNGMIVSKQYFNRDTLPDGPNIEYFPNGKVESWRWYSSKYKNPYCGVFYKDDGSFDTLKGKPFLGIGNNPTISRCEVALQEFETFD